MGITNLAGLKFATNVEVLNISGNRISSLSNLRPAIDVITGQDTGLRRLLWLAIEFNDASALSFDGVDDYVQLDKELINNESAITLEFWFRTTETGEQVVLTDDILGESASQVPRICQCIDLVAPPRGHHGLLESRQLYRG